MFPVPVGDRHSMYLVRDLADLDFHLQDGSQCSRRPQVVGIPVVEDIVRHTCYLQNRLRKTRESLHGFVAELAVDLDRVPSRVLTEVLLDRVLEAQETLDES